MATDSDERVQPIFVDRTGRRRRFTVLVGICLGVVLTISLAMIVVGLFTGSPAPLPGWPERGHEQQRDDAVIGPVVQPPPPAPSATATGTRSHPKAPAASATRAAASPTPPRPPATDQPGQGDLHRNGSLGKPSRPPGRPG